MLSVLAGESLDRSMVFVKPTPDDELISPVINRPELQMFNAQEAAVETQKLLLKARNMPKLGAFAQGGYGKPGLNMFDNDFSPYFLGGIRLSWNFGNLYTLATIERKSTFKSSRWTYKEKRSCTTCPSRYRNSRQRLNGIKRRCRTTTRLSATRH